MNNVKLSKVRQTEGVWSALLLLLKTKINKAKTKGKKIPEIYKQDSKGVSYSVTALFGQGDTVKNAH